MSATWSETVPPDAAWRCRKSMTRKARTAEQDRAAGGREIRQVPRSDGRMALASVSLRLYRQTRRIRAYLRWSDSGETEERYLGEVTHKTRAENLRAAWNFARSADLLAHADAPSARESWASSPAVREVMRANRSRDTKPEVALRSALHRLGLRYRVGQRPVADLRRTADLVFSRARVAVFVDGCYWHGCPEHHRPSRTNAAFWQTKIEGNKRRDAETDSLLSGAGWQVVRIWEHEPTGEAALRVVEAVRTRQTGHLAEADVRLSSSESSANLDGP
jgi:DNA mismatch endonuclease (patch repair protein)